jgi:Uma2 family endonuclease
MASHTIEKKQRKKPKKVKTSIGRKAKYEGYAIPLDEYHEWDPEDPFFKYEWNNGILEKRERTMKQKEMQLVQKLNQLFSTTKAFEKGYGLFSEVMCKTSPQTIRIPDISCYNNQQIRNASNENNLIPEFIIELLSKNDTSDKIEKKLLEYFNAGIKVIWYINPRLRFVKVYHSPSKVKICREGDICSAAPIIPDFEISVDELFKQS